MKDATIANEEVRVPAGVAAGHPATAEVGLRVLAGGGTAADAAVAAVLTSCVSESILTGITGGGFATYYDATSRTVTCLDFFVSVPGLDGDREPGPMAPIEVNFGGVPLTYSIGGATVAVPGVPAGCGEVHKRWGRLPWHSVVAPAISLARSGVVLPAAQAHALTSIAPAMLPGAGAEIYAPGGRLLVGGDLLHHPGLDLALTTLAEEGPSAFYTGHIGEVLVESVRAAGGALGPADLAAYDVLELPVTAASLAGQHVYARHDLNNTIPTVAALAGAHDVNRAARAVLMADALRDHSRQRVGDTTNIAVVDPEGNACVVTTTLGLGSGVWLPGLGVHMNSMLGEGELLTADLAPGRRMQSMMCPLVVTEAPAVASVPPADVPHGTGMPNALVDAAPDGGPAVRDVLDAHDLPVPHPRAVGHRDTDPGDDVGNLVLAAGSAGASRIRTALLHTLVNVLVLETSVAEAISRPRFHVVDDTVHVEPDYPADEVAALEAAGYLVNRWSTPNHYFGGASAVGRGGAAGDPRRGGIGLLL